MYYGINVSRKLENLTKMRTEVDGCPNSGSLFASRRWNFSTVGSARWRESRSAISMTLHPANVQNALEPRAHVGDNGRTYVYTSVRPNTFPFYCHLICRPLAAPIARSFHIRPRCDAHELSNSRLSSLPFYHLSLYHLTPGKGTETGGLFTLYVDATVLLHTRRRIREQMRSHNQHYWRYYSPQRQPYRCCRCRNHAALKCAARHHRYLYPLPPFLATFRILVDKPRRRRTNKQTTPLNCLCPSGFPEDYPLQSATSPIPPLYFNFYLALFLCRHFYESFPRILKRNTSETFFWDMLHSEALLLRLRNKRCPISSFLFI